LNKHNHHTTKVSKVYEYTDGPTSNPTDNQPVSDGLGDIHQIIPKLSVLVFWQFGTPIGPQFSCNLDANLK
jgi:hypothetical protein